jgi:uncharacterized membrane protein YdjX (TVP38/TMEM64 family)
VKNKFFLCTIIFILISLTIFFLLKSNKFFYNINIFEKINDLKQNNFIKFFFILFLINLIIFLTPIPTTPFIVFNGYILGNYGFILSYLTVVLCSIILFKFMKNLKFIFPIKFINKITEKIHKNKNNDLNFFIIASSRYIFPYFFHNVFFGSILKKINIFIYAILVTEIPIVFMLNQAGKKINEASDISTIESILTFDYLILFISFIFVVFIVRRSVKFSKKNKIIYVWHIWNLYKTSKKN